MAVPFSRSLRSLRADGFRYTLAALLVAALLLLAWLIWLFNATVTDWETSRTARVVDGEFVDATFAAVPLRRIARGQTALFYPDAADGQEAGLGSGTGLAAVVAEVERGAGGDDDGRVTLVLRQAGNDGRTSRAALADGAAGRVTVEVARRSPAALLFKAAGASRTTPSSSSSARVKLQ